MDSLRTSEDIKQLRKLREHYENQLKLLGLDMCDFDEVLQADLNEYADLQKFTNLSNMRLDLLKIYHYERIKDEIEYTALTQRLQHLVEEQDALIEQIELDCNNFQEFITSVEERKVSEAEMQSNQLQQEDKIADLRERLNSLNIPGDINMDELLRKIEEYKKHTAKDN